MRLKRFDRRGFGGSSGLTILEVLVALSIISIAFLLLAMTQITNLKATVRTTSITDLKAAANVVLEKRMAAVLEAEIVQNPTSEGVSPSNYDVADTYRDSSDTTQTRYLKFWFVDYYYKCSPDKTYSGERQPLRDPACQPTDSEEFGDVSVAWEYTGRTGTTGEGLLDIIVTATHDSGAELTIGDVISCYDVYPSPSSEVPMPCPTPADPYGLGGA